MESYSARGSVYIYIYVCVYTTSSFHSSINGHIGCCHMMAIANSAAIEHWGTRIFLIYF